MARFLTPQERTWAVERLRNNNTGLETSEWDRGALQEHVADSAIEEVKWGQVLETFLSPALWVYFIITFCVK